MFKAGFQKIAGLKTELAGTVLYSPLAIPGVIGGLVTGAHKKAERKAVDNSVFTNFIPGVGAVRLGRRMQRDSGE